MVKELIWVVFVNVSQYKFEDLWNIAVAPFAGAWIEMMKNNFEFGLFMVAPFVGVRIEISGTEVTEMSCSVAPFMGAWIEIWVSQAEFARSRIVFDFEDSSVQAEAAKKMEKYVQDNSFKGISQTTNILETRYIPNTPPVSEEPSGDNSSRTPNVKTGDDTNVIMWLSLMGISLVIFSICKRKVHK